MNPVGTLYNTGLHSNCNHFTMTEIISKVLNFTFGLLADRARNEITEHLADGDVTHEECRRLITKELDNIKTKLDGLARKDLVSSIFFLQDGINELYQSIFQCQSLEDDAVESTGIKQSNSSASLGSLKDEGPDARINDAIILLRAVKSLKVHSNEELKNAKEMFKLAYENATKAFSNDTLDIEDRIQALQVRMMATILEKLENPDAALRSCLEYLKQLYSIGTIRETFSVLIDGGITSRLCKTRRLKIASAVHLSNQLLFRFAQKYTHSHPVMFDWPMILLGGRAHHPVFGEIPLPKKLDKCGVTDISLEPNLLFDDTIDPVRTVVNSKTEVIVQTEQSINGKAITIHKLSGETRTLCKVSERRDASECRVITMDIDADDNLYFVAGRHEVYYQPFNFRLFIFDKNGHKTFEHALPFLQYTYWPRVSISVSRDGKIAILDPDSGTLYIAKNFSVRRSFEIYKVSNFHPNKTATRLMHVRYLNNKIVLASASKTLYICTEDGRLERKFKIPARNAVIDSIAINYATGHILVKVSDKEQLYRFSETGQFIENLCLGSGEWIHDAVLTSHPNGAVALIGKTEAAFLQL